MTEHRVVLTAEAKEDLMDLDGAARKIVVKALIKLKSSPEKRGQPLGSLSTSNLTTFRKLVVGNRQYRVVFRVEDDGTVCVVWVIGTRTDDEVYELAKARLQTSGGAPIHAQLLETLEVVRAL